MRNKGSDSTENISAVMQVINQADKMYVINGIFVQSVSCRSKVFHHAALGKRWQSH